MDQKVRQLEVFTQDGSVDRHGNPAIRAKTGKWLTAILILGIYIHRLFLVLVLKCCVLDAKELTFFD